MTCNACPIQASRELHASRRSYLVRQALHDSVVSAVKEGCRDSDDTRKRGFALFQKSMEAADGSHCLQLNPTQSTLGLQLRHLQAVDQLQGSKEKVLQHHWAEHGTIGNSAIEHFVPFHAIVQCKCANNLCFHLMDAFGAAPILCL